MKPKLETPQEVEVWYLLPAIRKQLVIAMINKGLKQKDVAKHLKLTDAAISQYMHNKRAADLRLPEHLIKKIDKSALKIMSKESSLQKEVQDIVHSMRDSKFICGVCRNCTGASSDCGVCYT
ncbi:MAG: hypothetical protein AABX51_08245 [Nanoarchaeota archaeon]